MLDFLEILRVYKNIGFHKYLQFVVVKLEFEFLIVTKFLLMLSFL